MPQPADDLGGPRRVGEAPADHTGSTGDTHAGPETGLESEHDADQDVLDVAAGPFAAEGQLDISRARYAKRLASRGGFASLDRLAALATRLLGTASAQVTLIEAVQTVVGGAGLGESAVGEETPLTDALCTLVVEGGAPVRIDDAAAEERVAHRPLVAEGVIGSYLGVPLVAAGHVVGALCVFDPVARAWTDDEESLLTALAQSVAVELELAALEADYADDRLVWQLAIDAGGVGAFDWDLVSGELRWDERLLELFGLDRHTFGGTIEAFNAAVHPDDLDRVTRALDDAISTCGAYAAEYRVILPDGGVRWLGARGRALAGPDGSAVRVIGAASDTTAVRDQEARVARVLESMPTAFFNLDQSWRFTYANSEAKRLLGEVSSDIIGGVIWDLFPAANGTVFETNYRHAMESGDAVAFEAYYPPPLDSWYEVRAWPSPDGLAVYFVDITERRRAQEALDRAGRRSTLVADVTAELAGTLDPAEATARLAQLVVPELGDWCIVTLVDAPPTDRRHGEWRAGEWRRHLRDVGWWHVEPDARDLVDSYVRHRLDALSDSSYLARATRSTTPVVMLDGATQAIVPDLAAGRAREALAALAPTSAVVVPMRARGRTVGLLSVFRGPGQRSPTGRTVATVQEIAGRAGLVVDNARLYEAQRDLAEQLQRSMMTAPPEPDHMHVVVRYEPAAEAAQVGGDWYDAFLQHDGATNVVIGDVVGHDTAAAAAMGQLRSLLRGIAVTSGEDPAGVLRRVDETIRILQMETTATAIVARFEQTEAERDAGITRLRWSNAGHPPLLVAQHPQAPETPETSPTEEMVSSQDVLVETLWPERTELLLGLEPGFPRTATVTELTRGSTVLLYTDGLVERRGELIDVGVERLRGVFGELVAADLELDELCDQIIRRMVPRDHDDDVALVAVRLHPEDRPRPAAAGPTRVPDPFAEEQTGQDADRTHP